MSSHLKCKPKNYLTVHLLSGKMFFVKHMETKILLVFLYFMQHSNCAWHSLNSIVWNEDKTMRVLDNRALIYMVLPLENPCLQYKEVMRRLNMIELPQLLALYDCTYAFNLYVKEPLEASCQIKKGQNYINYTQFASEHSTFFGSVLYGKLPLKLEILEEIYLPLKPDQSGNLAEAITELVEYKFNGQHELLSLTNDSLIKELSDLERSFGRAEKAFKFEMNSSTKSPKFGKPVYDLLQGNSETELRKRLLFEQEIESDCFRTFGSTISPLVHIVMSIPLASRDMIVLKADPMKFLVTKGETACEVNYSGPQYIIFDKDLKSFHLVDKVDTNSNLFDAPIGERMVRKNVANDSVFQLGTCFPFRNDTYLDYVQVKLNGGDLNIYCPFSTISIGGLEEPCPNYPFTVDGSFEISINGELYSNGLEEDRIDTERFYSLNVDWYLRPTINLTRLSAEIPESQVENN